MLLAVEGGGFFSSSASGYTHGLALLLLGKRHDEKPVRVDLPWNHYRVVEREACDEYHLASSPKDQVSSKCSSFICFGCSAGTNGDESSARRHGLASRNGESSDLPCGSRKSKERSDDYIGLNARRGCLKSNLKRDSSEHCTVVGESRDSSSHEPEEEVELDVSCSERRKVHWTDTCGKDLAEIREFEASEAGGSDDDPDHGRFRRCECVIQ